jgi:hypothetical protein
MSLTLYPGALLAGLEGYAKRNDFSAGLAIAAVGLLRKQ